MGGIEEKRFPESVWFKTTINVKTSLEVEVTVETLLEEGVVLMQDEDAATDVDVTEKPEHTQTYTRTGETKIPFVIHFDLDMQMWASMDVVSAELRVAAALLDTAVLTVTPDEDPIAKAQIEFVTIIPAPLFVSYGVRF